MTLAQVLAFEDAKLQVRARSILGEKYLELTPQSRMPLSYRTGPSWRSHSADGD